MRRLHKVYAGDAPGIRGANRQVSLSSSLESLPLHNLLNATEISIGAATNHYIISGPYTSDLIPQTSFHIDRWNWQAGSIGPENIMSRESHI